VGEVASEADDTGLARVVDHGPTLLDATAHRADVDDLSRALRKQELQRGMGPYIIIVGLDRIRVDSPPLFDLTRAALDLLVRAADQRDIGTERREPVGDRLPQTIATRSGHEGLLARQVHQVRHTLADDVRG
jgi:hypothetical protein